MTQQPQSVPQYEAKDLAPSSISKSMDEAISALSVFDAERLETIQEQVRGLTAEYLARELAEGREALPELLRKHTLLGEMLNATAANLRVVVAILEAKRTGLREGLHAVTRTATGSISHDFSHDTSHDFSQDRSNLVSWPL